LRNYGTPVFDEVEQFVTGRRTTFADRMRTTILFTDIVDSTPLAASLGDVRWGVLIDDHNDRLRRLVVAHGGYEVKSTGDGFLVAFDEPEPAILCARACMDAVRDLGLALRPCTSPSGSAGGPRPTRCWSLRPCGRAAPDRVSRSPRKGRPS
jgi:class 3 adenylate cyclase